MLGGRRLLAVMGVILVTALALGGSVLAQARAPSEDELLTRLEKGGTPADHQALAAHYRSEADAAEQKATHHEAMAGRYTKLGGKADWATHCRNLVSHYRKAAAEFRMLAEMHTKEASP